MIVEGRVLITLDEHFGDWAILPIEKHPGVIRLKIHPPTVVRLADYLLPTLQRHKQEDFANHLVGKEGSQLVTNCHRLKLRASDGKSHPKRRCRRDVGIHLCEIDSGHHADHPDVPAMLAPRPGLNPGSRREALNRQIARGRCAGRTTVPEKSWRLAADVPPA